MRQISCAVAVCLMLAACGCAARPAQPTPTATGAILTYAPATRNEARRQRRLFEADRKARNRK